MAEQDGLSADELLLIDDRWSWALQLLQVLVDDEPVVGADPEDDDLDQTAAGQEPSQPTGGPPTTVAGDGYDPEDPNSASLAGGDGDDMLDGMAGNDLLSGGRGDDIVDGGGGDDGLLGGAGDDMLLGQGGNDVLDGGDGDDDVGGDGGDDRLTGGRGSDIFSFDLMATGSPGVDTITDFARGEDLIWIMGSGAQWLALDSDGSGTLDDGDLAVSVDGEGLRIELHGMHSGLAGTGAAIVLRGITELDRGDILLVDI